MEKRTGTELMVLAQPAMQAANAKRVRRGFWPKIRRYATLVPFAEEALTAWHCASDPRTPSQVRAIVLAALAYFVLPADAVPDILAAIGFGDDAAVFWAAWAMVERHIRPEHRMRAQSWIATARAEDADTER